MRHPLRPSIEQEMLRSLAMLAQDVFRDGDADAARRMPQLAYRIADEAADRMSATLMDQAIGLWLRQLYSIDLVPDGRVRNAVAELVSELPYYVVARLTSQVEDEYRPLAERLAPEALLLRLARFQVRALKHHLDSNDVDAFTRAWQRSQDGWFRHWRPDQDKAELEFRLSVMPPARQRDVRGALRLADELVEAKERILRGRDHDVLQLGSWLALSLASGRVEAALFHSVATYLTGGFSSVGVIVGELERLNDVDWDVSLLEDWLLPTADTRGRVHVGWVPDRDAARLWLTLLLVRAVGSRGEPPDREAGLADWLVQQIASELERFRNDPDKWAPFIGNVEALGSTERWLSRQGDRGRAVRQEALASASPDPGRVAEFARGELAAFRRVARVRSLVALAGALTVEVDAGLTPRLQLVDRKEPFLADGPSFGSDVGIGAAVARDEEARIYSVLAEVAGPAPPAAEVGDAALAAIMALGRDGFAADVILVPATVWVRPILSKHPRFRWNSQFVGETGPLGYLDDVPVYDVGPSLGDQLIVVDLKRSMGLKERRIASGPLAIEIRAIDDARARTRVAGGDRFEDHPEWTADEIADYLKRFFVEILVFHDFEVEILPTGPRASRRISIPGLPRDNDE